MIDVCEVKKYMTNYLFYQEQDLYYTSHLHELHIKVNATTICGNTVTSILSEHMILRDTYYII
jgi:hypothetical protein